MPRLSKIGAACLAAFGYTGITLIPASYVVVAGGGGAFNVRGGGGGAGGMLSGTTNLNPTLSYVVTVGAGGVGLLAGQSSGATAGVNSSIGSIATAIGGGVGSGGNGGSGGGAGGGAGAPSGTGTAGQGNNGGSGANYGSGGGGGAGAVGGNGTTSVSGNGGTGLANPITGSTSGQNVSGTYYFAGGGGGGHQTNLGGTRGLGGNGGGGNGGLDGTTVGADGSSNTGGGGGGGGGDGANYFKSGFGGSGIAIISYTSPTQLFGGGVVTFSGGNWIHTFNTSGVLTPISTFTASYLVVAGGGSGGASTYAINIGAGSGGGGAGGLLSGNISIDTNSNYVVTVGAGAAAVGAGVSNQYIVGIKGSNSSISSILSTGGGGGTAYQLTGNPNGGSGGGAAASTTAGTGISGQGNNGGAGFVGGGYGAGGGGGASAVGSAGTTSAGGNGGNGAASSISGSSVTYAGGGGGTTLAGAVGTGGSGGGGNGGATGSAGAANLGAGGGGSGYGTGGSGAGGSGIVIISYAGTQRMAGGTVTFVGGNTIHTFTSSGFLTALKLVNNSLRFKSSTSSYLTKTPASAGNQQKWTWSSWIKRGSIGTLSTLFAQGTGSTAAGYAGLRIYNGSSDTIEIYGSPNGSTASIQWSSNSVYRDPAAWYHIVAVLDTTQATAANRFILYVNGVLQSGSFGTTPTQNANIEFNRASAHQIGAANVSSLGQYFDGYMAEINFIDGQALTPTSFGAYNSYGVWQPAQYAGSYGTNGFYLPFTNNASSTTIGYDFSPNGKNWTATGFTLTPTTSAAYDSMTDVPTLTSTTASNFCVMNAVSSYSGLPLISGNIQTSAVPSGANWFSRSATIGVSSGKWYAEFSMPSITAGAQGNPVGFGIIPSANDFTAIGQQVGNPSFGYGFYCPDTAGATPKKIVNNVTTAVGTGTATTTSDVFMVAFDLTNGNAWFGKNGTWYAGDPSAGTGASITGITAGEYLFALSIYRDTTYTNNTAAVNFGQRPFSYSLPTNYLALNTFNM